MIESQNEPVLQDSVESAPEVKVQTDSQTNQNSEPEPELKNERRENRQAKEKNWEKMYNDSLASQNHWRSTYDRKFAEQSKKLAEFSKYSELLKEATEYKEKQSLESLKKENPDEYQKKLIAAEVAKLQSTVAPAGSSADSTIIYSSLNADQRQEYAQNVENYLAENYGAENLKTYSSAMANIWQKSSAQERDSMTNRPDILMRLAAGDQYLQEKLNQSQKQQQEAAKNQQANSRFAKGSAKPYLKNSKEEKSEEEMSDRELIQSHYENLRKK